MSVYGYIEKKRSGNLMWFMFLTVIVILFFFLDIFLGSVSIHPSEVFSAVFNPSGSDHEVIILKFRLPKAFTALLVGSALSLSGLQMQTVFRNPMAGPYVLGISSGASLGVAIVILGAPAVISGLPGAAGNWLLAASAWAGAGAVLLIIMLISSRVKDIMTVLIIGIMLASGISALVTVLQYFSSETMLKAYVIWTMGSLGNLTSGQLSVLAVSVISGILMSIFLAKRLNAMLLGENYASSLGIGIRITIMLVFVCTSILAGSVTAFCGPIGFIGIAAPHLARIVFRTSDHLVLIPGTLLAGSAVMILSDIISQLPGSGSILPVNAITSLIGIPIVIWIIVRNRKYSAF